jgi:hypothetical protein
MNRDILGMYLFENNIISVELAKVLRYMKTATAISDPVIIFWRIMVM